MVVHQVTILDPGSPTGHHLLQIGGNEFHHVLRFLRFRVYHDPKP